MCTIHYYQFSVGWNHIYVFMASPALTQSVTAMIYVCWMHKSNSITVQPISSITLASATIGWMTMYVELTHELSKLRIWHRRHLIWNLEINLNDNFNDSTFYKDNKMMIWKIIWPALSMETKSAVRFTVFSFFHTEINRESATPNNTGLWYNNFFEGTNYPANSIRGTDIEEGNRGC